MMSTKYMGQIKKHNIYLFSKYFSNETKNKKINKKKNFCNIL